jgi:hypothetical protein
MPNHPVVVSGAIIVVSVAVAVSFPSFIPITAHHHTCENPDNEKHVLT